MKLSEILKIPQMTEFEAKIPLSQKQLENAERVGVMGGGLSVYRCQFAEDEIAFFCGDARGPISIYILLPTTICSIGGYLGRRSWTRIDKRQQGIGSDLFVFIHGFLKKPIFTDDAQTPSSQGLWKSLSKRYAIKVINTSTGQIQPRSEVPGDVIYTLDAARSADYLMMIEAKAVSVIPEASNKLKQLLTPYRLFGDGDI